MVLRSPIRTRLRRQLGRADQGRRRRLPRQLVFEPLERRQLLTATADLLTRLSDGEGESNTTSVALRLEVTDLAGVPITETIPGSDFHLLAWVSDQRLSADPAGVFAAYLDITYDDDLLSVVKSTDNRLGFDIEFGPAYENGISGNVSTAGLIDEVGAFQTGFQPLGASDVLLFRARFSTGDVNLVDDRFDGILEDPGPIELDVLANDHLQVGTVRFTGSPADIRPLHDVVLYSPASVVPDEALQFVPAELRISGAGIAVIDEVGTPSAGGSVWVAGDGTSLVYEPAPNFHGTETFTYQVAGREAVVTVVVEPVNDAPVGSDDIYVAAFEDPLVVDVLRGVLANDHDVEDDPLVVRIVRQPTSGTVTLQEDGSFEYLPAAGFRGRDTFTYVADDARLLSREITVRIDVGTPQVSIRLAVTDAAGQQVDRVTSEDSLFLRAWVEDLRDEYYANHGVFAAYLDVLFDAQFLQPIVDAALPRGFEIDFGPEFGAPGSGDVNASGLVNEVGSFALSFEPLGAGEILLFEMPLDVVSPRVADDEYNVSFQSSVNQFDVLENDLPLVWSTDLIAESADESPDHDVLMFQPPMPVADDQIIFTSTSLELANPSNLLLVGTGATAAGGIAVISDDGEQLLYSPPQGFVGTDSFTYTVADARGRTAEATVTVDVARSWRNVRNPLDVNSDTYVSPIDALLVIHDLNQDGARILVEPPSGPPFIDVNGDGQLSPIDALIVIHFLNGSSAEGVLDGEGEGESSSDAYAVSLSATRAADALSRSLLIAPPATQTSALSNVRHTTEPAAATRPLRSPAVSAPAKQLLPTATEELDELFQRWDRLRAVSRVELALEDLLELLGDEQLVQA